MGNVQPGFCPHCGSALTVAKSPTDHERASCDRYVVDDPPPGGGVAVVDGDRLQLVEDVPSPGEWRLPSGAVEAGESLRERAARELEGETDLTVDPFGLASVRNGACEPVACEHLTDVTVAVDRSASAGPLESGSDATNARFCRPDEFAVADSFTDVHVDRFRSDSLEWLLERTRGAHERRGVAA